MSISGKLAFGGDGVACWNRPPITGYVDAKHAETMLRRETDPEVVVVDGLAECTGCKISSDGRTALCTLAFKPLVFKGEEDTAPTNESGYANPEKVLGPSFRPTIPLEESTPL